LEAIESGFTLIEADIFKQTNNLSEMPSPATARTNLGLGTMAVETAADYLTVANNLSDVASASTARTNLGLGTASVQADTYFNQTANNLSDVADAPTARTNLGLGTASVQADTYFNQTANNLSDVADAATSRTNLGLGTMAVETATDYLTVVTAASTYLPFTGGTLTGDLYLDTDMGIGTTTPEAQLHVHGGGTATVPTLSTGTLAKFHRSTAVDSNSGISITAGSSGTSFLDFSDTSDADVGGVSYNHLNNYMAFTVNTSEAARFDNSRNFMVGRASASGSAQDNGVVLRQEGYITSAMDGTGTNQHVFIINNAAVSPATVGSISSNGSTTSYNTSSDYRLKHDYQVMNPEVIEDRLYALRPITFKWNVNDDVSEGFLAHELQQVIPDAVTGSKDAVDENGSPVYQVVDHSKVVPLLTAALQQAFDRIEDLESRLELVGIF